MKRRMFFVSLAVVVVLGAVWAIAGNHGETTTQHAAKSEQSMPAMGPPEQMSDLDWLEGTWDVVMQSRWDPSQDWMTSKGTSTYMYVLGGSAMHFVYKSEFMGRPFEGSGIQCYDRETKQWQVVWTDNMSARISMYEGTRTGDKTVMMGEDVYEGQTFLSRITTSEETKASFDWMMEYSMDNGQTWMVSGKAKYTRRS